MSGKKAIKQNRATKASTMQALFGEDKKKKLPASGVAWRAFQAAKDMKRNVRS